MELSLQPLAVGFILDWGVVVFVAVAVVGVTVVRSVVTVEDGQRRLYFRLGEFQRVLDPGRHVVVPFVSRTPAVDVTEQTTELSQAAILTDGERVHATASVRFEVVDPETVYREVSDYSDSLVTVGETRLGATLGERSSDDLFSDGCVDAGTRNAVHREFRDAFGEILAGWGIELIEVAELTVEQSS